MTSPTLAKMTPAELERMRASTDVTGMVCVVEHPARLHAEFVAGNLANHGNTLLEAVDLGDGWVRVAYALAAAVAM